MNCSKWFAQYTEHQLQQCSLDWWPHLETQLHQHIAQNQGNWQHYLQVIAALPEIPGCQLDASGDAITLTSPQKNIPITTTLQALRPWRKGPFSLFDHYIDSEWQCQYKWQRIEKLLNWHGKRVLDVGGGNGYFAWKLTSLQATVTIVDPSPLYWAQFSVIARYLDSQTVCFVPTTLAETPQSTFDIVVCMGVLYHSPAPFTLLRQLRQRVRKDGWLLLETLVVAGDEHTVFTPQDRYAGMNNVWSIPSITACERWLTRCGFRDIVATEPILTTSEEQRSTVWSNSKSLQDFLDESGNTCEGHPPPQRAVFIARR